MTPAFAFFQRIAPILALLLSLWALPLGAQDNEPGLVRQGPALPALQYIALSTDSDDRGGRAKAVVSHIAFRMP